MVIIRMYLVYLWPKAKLYSVYDQYFKKIHSGSDFSKVFMCKSVIVVYIPNIGSNKKKQLS